MKRVRHGATEKDEASCPAPTTAPAPAPAPASPAVVGWALASPAVAGWAGLPFVLFDLSAELLTSSERADAAEWVCTAWRRHSLLGGGWGYALDLLAMPSSREWESVRARLGGRFRPERLRHLRCYSRTLAVAADDGGAPLLSNAPDDGSAPNAPDARAERSALTDLHRAATAAAMARARAANCVFPRCETLVLATLRGDDLQGLDLQPLFPQLSHLHIVMDAQMPAWPATSASIGVAAATPSAVALGVADTVADTVAVAQTVAMRERFAWMAASRTPDTTNKSSITNLPRMAHVAHLRVSSCNGIGSSATVVLWGALSNLLSLQTFAGVRLAVKPCVELPRLAHAALFHGTESTAWMGLISAAKSTLVSLMDYHLTLDDVRFLAQAQVQSLRVLHFTTINRRDPTEYCPALSNIPSLRDVGIYSHYPLVDVRASMATFSMGGPPTYPFAESPPRLAHFTVADLSPPTPPPLSTAALPADAGVWHSSTAIDAKGVRRSFFSYSP